MDARAMEPPGGLEIAEGRAIGPSIRITFRELLLFQ
jgi:hypothetical protein